ncbi:hypothetical protein LJC42_07785 [Eubacteriales bacterium OttesenSCG-928-K08]|nr:hypothetical protein [Eubacteriales bacterium OttesenSCG-928-K08]
MNKAPTRMPQAAFEFEGQSEPHAEAARGPARLPALGKTLRAPEDIKQELTMLLQSGNIPEGFDINLAAKDPAFMELVMEFPVEAAVRIYAAESRAMGAGQEAMMQLAQRVRSRSELPQSTRVAAGGAPGRDYRTMSSEDFASLEEQFRELSRNGLKVKL